ncbi:MAG: peptidylprolyl isomerase [Candidatus Hinthialibacter antarcticus]|nr:peptidylprolyl isomerase [Candidatus Hinthialibacter antarcticus]
MRRILLVPFALCAIALLAASVEAQDTKEKKMDIKPEEEIALLQTSEGDMVLRFFPDVAPGHVKNFKDLARKKDDKGELFYDGTKFHRVIKGFMIQGGDPLTKDDSQAARWGTGGPGHSVKAEFNKKSHKKGTLSMARSASPDSGGSQFFICHQAAPHLDGQYTVFGELVEGLDVLDKIAETKVGGPQRSTPVEPIVVKHVKIMTWEKYEASKKAE